jgi:hypothetical protein
MATKKINLSLENLVVLEKIWVLNSLIDNQEPLELCSKAYRIPPSLTQLVMLY